MKSHTLNTLLFLLIIPVIGMAQGNLKTLERQDYSIQFPSKWYLEEIEEMGIVLIDDEENPKLITTLIATPSDDTSLSETRKELLENSGLENAKAVKDEILQVGDKEMLHLVFRGANEDNSEPFRIEEFFVLHNNRSFILVFACSEDAYPKVKESIEQISNSFQLK